MEPDFRSFILANARRESVPLAGDIKLHLVGDLTPVWQTTQTEFDQLLLPPPFWALAWLGGRALARYVLDNPNMVHAKRVLDLAAGSGIAAIAAAQADADRVSTSDIDEIAAAAITLNAELNGVEIAVSSDNLIGSDDGWEIILAGDICYEKPLAEDAIDWLRTLAGRGAIVLLGDPGRDCLPARGLLRCADYDIALPASLESQVGRSATVWRVKGNSKF